MEVFSAGGSAASLGGLPCEGAAPRAPHLRAPTASAASPTPLKRLFTYSYTHFLFLPGGEPGENKTGQEHFTAMTRNHVPHTHTRSPPLPGATHDLGHHEEPGQGPQELPVVGEGAGAGGQVGGEGAAGGGHRVGPRARRLLLRRRRLRRLHAGRRGAAPSPSPAAGRGQRQGQGHRDRDTGSRRGREGHRDTGAGTRGQGRPPHGRRRRPALCGPGAAGRRQGPGGAGLGGTPALGEGPQGGLCVCGAA